MNWQNGDENYAAKFSEQFIESFTNEQPFKVVAVWKKSLKLDSAKLWRFKTFNYGLVQSNKKWLLMFSESTLNSVCTFLKWSRQKQESPFRITRNCLWLVKLQRYWFHYEWCIINITTMVNFNYDLCIRVFAMKFSAYTLHRVVVHNRNSWCNPCRFFYCLIIICKLQNIWFQWWKM